MKKFLFFKRPDWRQRKPQTVAALSVAVLLVAVFLASNQELWRQTPESGPEIEAAGLEQEALLQELAALSDDSEPADLNDAEELIPEQAETLPAPEEPSGEAVSAAKEETAYLPPAAGKWDRVFGYGYDVTFEDYRFHAGMDMTLPLGELVLAVSSGEVLLSAADEQWGGIVLVKSGETVVGYYGITPASLNKGQKIEAGEIVGTVAPAPLRESVQKPHLHLEITVNGVPQNPADYFKL